MNRQSKALGLFAVLLLLLGVRGLSAQEDAAWKERLRQEAPPAWEKYLAWAKGLQGTYSERIVYLKPKDLPTSLTRFEFKQAPGCALYLEENEVAKDKKSARLQVVNPRYEFELVRQGDRPWWISKQSSADSEPDKSIFQNVEYATALPVTFASIYGALRMTADAPGLDWKRVTPLAGDKKGWVSADFVFQPQDDNPRAPSITGRVVFDPTSYWVIREFDVAMAWASRPDIAKHNVSGKLEYERSADGFPVLKRCVTKHQAQKKGGDEKEFENTLELECKHGEISESAFMLSAFGFPEPATSSFGRRSLWLALSGIVFLVLAVFLKWRARRVSAAKTSTTTLA